jgi:hypothetical protein
MSLGGGVRPPCALTLPVATVHSAVIRTSTPPIRNLISLVVAAGRLHHMTLTWDHPAFHLHHRTNLSSSKHIVTYAGGWSSSKDGEIGSKFILKTHFTANERCRKHILQDLEPYLCPLEFCDNSTQNFTTWNRLHEHLHHSHPSQVAAMCLSSCVFCDQKIEGTIRDLMRHIGRHMEEIAFAVVPRAYEDWAFYSDSDDATKLKLEFDTGVKAEEFDLEPSQRGSSQEEPSHCVRFGSTSPPRSQQTSKSQPSADASVALDLGFFRCNCCPKAPVAFATFRELW